MTAAPSSPTPDVVVVDLDAMTLDELRMEQVTVRNEIEKIKMQLDDEERVYRLGIEYPDWRRRARLALRHRKEEARLIHVTLQERQRAEKERRRAEAQAAHEARMAQVRADAERRAAERRAEWASEVAAQREAARVRAGELADLEAAPIDLLLARVWVAFHRLSATLDPLPEVITPAERKALHTAKIHLEATFGKGFRAYFEHDTATEGV